MVAAARPDTAPAAAGAFPWRAWLALGGAALAAWAVLAVWTPPEDAAWSVCLFRRATGLECPSCGFTRALAHLAHGDLAGSFARHPLAAPFAAEGAALWLLAPLLLRGRRVGARGAAWFAAAHVVLLVAVWVARLAAR